MRFPLFQTKMVLALILTNLMVKLNLNTKTPLKMVPNSMRLSAEGGIWLDM